MLTIFTLLIFGVLLLLLEIIIPGGVIGFIGLVCILIGVILGFMQNSYLGLGLLSGVTVLGIFALMLWIKFFPKTPMGKKIFLDKDAKDWQGFENSNTDLVGLTGITHTALRPSGLAIIKDRRVDVVTQGELIERDCPIRVLKVEGNRIIVGANESSESSDK